jgi:hypothetical protein
MPLLRTKKEIFEWLKQGKKIIDVRKGKPYRGEFAYFQSGQQMLRLRIIKRETGRLTDLVHGGNYWLVIPSAKTLEDAVVYLQMLYGNCDGFFTAYYVKPATDVRNHL